MENKWLWIGGAAVLAVVLFLSRSGGAGSPTVIPAADTSAETAARFSFASSGLNTLGKVASDALGYASAERVATTTADAQVRVEQSRDNALVASTNAYADAQKYTSRQTEKAATNSSFWGAISHLFTSAADILAVVLP